MLRLLRNSPETKAIPPILIDDMIVDIKIHPRARSLTLRYDPRKERFILSSPKRASQKSRVKFLDECHAWMRKQINVAPPANYMRPGSVLPLEGKDRMIAHVDAPGVKIDLTDDTLTVYCRIERFPRALQRFIQQRAQDIIFPLCYQKAAIIDKQIQSIQLRDTTTRWGSCTYDKKLSFSWRLVLAPAEVVDYIVAHEVAHLQVFNHSEKFWELCRRLTPHTTFGKHWLHQNGNHLHQIRIVGKDV